MRALGTLIAGLAAATVSASALAHAPAQATGIAWSKGGSNEHALARVWVRTNRGLLIGDDEGTFRLLCNEALRVSSTEIPPVLVSRERTLIATYQDGLLAPAPDLCTFTPIALPLGEGRVLDLGASSDGTRVLALTAPTETELARVFASDDSGRTWTSGAAMNAFGSSLRLAPTDPSRVYIAQQPVTEDGRPSAELAVSEDGGQSFDRREITLNDNEVYAVVTAVGDPDPELVFVTTVRDDPLLDARLLISRDAGRSFVTALKAVGPLSVALDSESLSLFVGGRDGLFRSQDQGRTFTPLSSSITHVGCLVIHENALFVCGLSDDRFGIFRSTDEGATFTTYLSFANVREGVSCASGTEVAKACASSVEHWKSELPPEKPPDPGPVAPESEPRSQGCAFVVTPPSTGTWLSAWLLVAGLRWARRTDTKRPKASEL